VNEPPKAVVSEEGLHALADVRALATVHPGVTEAVDKFGHTSFRVRDKPFVMMGEGPDGPSLAIKADPFTQEHLIQQGGYKKTPYIGQHGWVSLLEVPPDDWTAVGQLIEDAYALVTK